VHQISDPLVQSYSLSPERRHAHYRRTLVVVIISQMFGGAGLAAGVTCPSPTVVITQAHGKPAQL
jgi:hypothetical protein